MILAKLTKIGFLKVCGQRFSQIIWIEVNGEIKEAIAGLPEHLRKDFEYREVDENDVAAKTGKKKFPTINGLRIKMLPKKIAETPPNEINSKPIVINVPTQPETAAVEPINDGAIKKTADLQMPKKNKR